MDKKKNRIDNDYRQLRRKILGKSVIMIIVSIAFVWLFYSLFLYQRFADFVVSVVNTLFHDYTKAALFYTHYIRNYIELYFLAAIFLVFIIILRFYLKSFTGYFNEINSGINSILEGSDDIKLSSELSATERKINSIKHTLAQQEQASREAEQRKNDLVMYLAHDIRTPLTSVIGYLNLLEEAPDMPVEQRAEYVHITLDKAYRLEKMVNEFFEITRYNVQEIILHKEVIDLYYMLLQLTDELTPIFSNHGNTIQINADENLTVYGDPEKLARVFNNVLKNAAAYSHANTPIEINASQVSDQIVVSIKNKGNTIPQDKLSNLFDRFFRLDEARSSNSGGTGLGLSIAKEIVLKHGGTIKAESAEDTVIFTIVLPLKFT